MENYYFQFYELFKMRKTKSLVCENGEQLVDGMVFLLLVGRHRRFVNMSNFIEGNWKD